MDKPPVGILIHLYTLKHADNWCGIFVQYTFAVTHLTPHRPGAGM